ncbi:16S rRNA (cytidine(1402)-2'-O)-methyltransferase [Candidatus Bipolaricaulota bacterium]|nr:16S rRNA (cytidine(1402)-2'-O)-methyltransferase [Candidatus Bipolaricaulota bacterium]
MPGTLYVCATPIGNLEDITLRALRVLREVDLIVGEDSRHTRKLLSHYDIHTPFAPSLYQGVEEARVEGVLRVLREGKDVALVCDAGTPLISDPGYPLVRACLAEGIKVVPVPGASAFLAALVASGLPPDRFLFLGYLPRKSGPRKKVLESLSELPYTAILYESPHRVLSTLEELARLFPRRPLVLARELTKVYEEFIHGTAEEVFAEVKRRGGVKGELVLLIAPADLKEKEEPEPEPMRKRFRELLDCGFSPGEAVKKVAEEFGIPRREAYRIVHGLAEN